MALSRTVVEVSATPEHAFAVFIGSIDRWWTRAHDVQNGELKEIGVDPQVGNRQGWGNQVRAPDKAASQRRTALTTKIGDTPLSDSADGVVVVVHLRAWHDHIRDSALRCLFAAPTKTA